MRCIYCGFETKVTNSRPQKRANQIWRRRQCLNCETIFSSTEAADLSLSVRVNKNNQLEPFSRDKLLVSVYESCRHRKDALEAATALTSTIISKLLPLITNATIQRDEIVTITAETLEHFDKPASIHYTAYHPFHKT